jgi:hypothetical protein
MGVAQMDRNEHTGCGERYERRVGAAMARLLCTIGVVGCCLFASAAAQAARPAIVGGTPISITQAPWQVVIEAGLAGGGGIRCGGSIIDASHILTAAHCVFDSGTHSLIQAENFIVLAGTSDFDSGPVATEQERAVTAVRPHPFYSYEPDSGHINTDDVAILTLETPLSLKTGPTAAVASIPLASATVGPPEGSPVNLTGFGKQDPQAPESSGQLYSIGMSIVYRRECGGEDDAVLICASSPAGSPCNGDSGSGLTFGSPAVLVGVEDDYFLVSQQACAAGAENALTNVAAPEIGDFIAGSEAPPRAPRGGGAAIRGITTTGNSLTCEPGAWSENPSFTYTFIDTQGQALQQGPSSTYPLTAADVGRAILCQVQATTAGGTGEGRTPSLRAVRLAVGTGQTAPPPVASLPTATLSSIGTSIPVQSTHAALVKLDCVGTASCQGKVTITATKLVKVKGRKGHKKRTVRRTVTVGSLSVTIAANQESTFNVKLNAAGRALLKARHGRLTVALVTFKLSPAPAKRATETVTLVQQKAGRR